MSVCCLTLSMYVGQRHRRGAEVGAVLGELLGPLAAQVGELVDVVVHRRRAFVRDQPILLHRVQQRIDEPKRQLEVVGQVAAGRFGAAVERLENQRFDLAVGEAGGGERIGLDRHPLAAVLLLTRQRHGVDASRAAAGRLRPAALLRRRLRRRELMNAVHQRVETTVVVAHRRPPMLAAEPLVVMSDMLPSSLPIGKIQCATIYL